MHCFIHLAQYVAIPRLICKVSHYFSLLVPDNKTNLVGKNLF